ncbi:M23 family metallopeptidase [Arsenicitalea aurantiaca]|uniref:M23 family metallopeptidase n=1 Tax=Arsenicitalea aurantiaca TaxID=1783274 RepID=A0A433XFP2_9HYPH|nr:M23 family metallopeptidase [Arsenicitalea aurantiaca]RUT32919.1 M23 family metallopeptidase [Arsenicitalea aurantiaca]
MRTPHSSVSARHHKGMRPALAYTLFALLCGTNALTLVGFLMSADVAALLNGRNAEILSAYEDRIVQLRVEVDRLHSRQYAQAGDINLQLQDLAQQQSLLSQQHEYIREIAGRASELGINAASIKTSVTEAPLVTGSLSLAGSPHKTPAPMTSPAVDDIAAHAALVSAMMQESRDALSAISQAASGSTAEIVSELKAIGIDARLPDLQEGMGGPFVPATDAKDAAEIAEEAEAAIDALIRFEAARDALSTAPIFLPIDGGRRVSSNFGTRRDPFTGRRAFHAGIDFPRPTGTPVLSAGAGKVSFVGTRSGYGKTVEITHESGLVTRYAHLSAYLVSPGASVAAGQPIARVGSTGRSTGPHLHFEVRRRDSPLDPTAFIEAGRRLQRFLTSV